MSGYPQWVRFTLLACVGAAALLLLLLLACLVRRCRKRRRQQRLLKAQSVATQAGIKRYLAALAAGGRTYFGRSGIPNQDTPQQQAAVPAPSRTSTETGSTALKRKLSGWSGCLGSQELALPHTTPSSDWPEWDYEPQRLPFDQPAAGTSLHGGAVPPPAPAPAVAAVHDPGSVPALHLLTSCGPDQQRPSEIIAAVQSRVRCGRYVPPAPVTGSAAVGPGSPQGLHIDQAAPRPAAAISTAGFTPVMAAFQQRLMTPETAQTENGLRRAVQAHAPGHVDTT